MTFWIAGIKPTMTILSVLPAEAGIQKKEKIKSLSNFVAYEGITLEKCR